MAGFDSGAVYRSDSLFTQAGDRDNFASFQQAKKKFKDFLRQYNVGGLSFGYRDQLKQNCTLKIYNLTLKIQDLNNFDTFLAQELIIHPVDYIATFEEAATEVASEIMKSSLESNEVLPPIQLLLDWDAASVHIRDMQSERVAKLVKISGIVVSASSVKSKATRLTLQCRGCRQYLPNIRVKPGFDGYMLPRKCPSSLAGGVSVPCPVDPFFIVPDKCECVDYQVLKLQESPDSIPQGEMPRHVQIYCDRYLVEQVAPGNRITVVGIYSIQTSAPTNKPRSGAHERVNVGVRNSYIRALGLSLNTEGPGRSGVFSAGRLLNTSTITTELEEEEMRKLANTPNIYELIARSIAPSIYGSLDIKKAIACLLFGGSRKRLPDGLCRRGDINLLLIGDPGTAKSQLLKFVERCAPVGVYTSGKGSSAAGLTASIIRDPATHNFVMEGGAMVLADGGVVCIDEFDKMREDDRVAIHEAMEQQTISIAKAGITTSLNSRCSVLAAANSVFGRWDDSKAESNIDFMPTILSRFDMIFVVKDEHDAAKDNILAHHVMQVHLHGNDAVANNEMAEDTSSNGEIPLSVLRRFIAFARERCGPRLSPAATEKLANQYVLMRSGASRYEQQTGKRGNIPITVRQLEAIVRISESLAKMRLDAFATEADVDEAMRLFQVSTLEAFMTGSLEGAEGFTSQEEHDLIIRVEKQLKKRFVIGSQVSEHAILQDFTRQGFSERTVAKVLHYMIRRGEIQYRMQRRILYRVK
nr:DNA replication licensing factor MCM5 [Hymenolepis microstoma]